MAKKILLISLIIFLVTRKEKPIVTEYKPEMLLNQQPIETKITPDKQKIINFIYAVFGDYANNAMYLLTNSKCHENKDLDPTAIHHNWSNTTPGIYYSSDWGLFQINDHWNGFTERASRFLLDYRINTLMAKKIFDDNNHSFSLWTCGAYLGL